MARPRVGRGPGGCGLGWEGGGVADGLRPHPLLGALLDQRCSNGGHRGGATEDTANGGHGRDQAATDDERREYKTIGRSREGLWQPIM